jgi:hypothetical protein
MMNPTLLRLTLPPALALTLMVAAWPVAAQTSDIEAVRAATAKLIGQLVDQGVLARDKGEALLSDVSRPAASSSGGAAAAAAGGAAAGAATGTVRVPYIPEFVRKELKEEIRAELSAQAFREGWTGPGSVPEWVRRLKWDGDMRVRFQMDRFANGNAPAVSVTETNRTRSITLLNTDEDRYRLRVRARLGLSADLDENWSAGIRLTTGSATDPVSSNQTLGVYNNRFTVAFDRAYMRYRFGDTFNVVAGRFGNPWFGTDLVWANDLSFDGIAAQWTPRLSDNLRGFFTVAALPIQEVELASADKWLFGGQVGVEASNLMGGVRGKAGLGYYRYQNTLGKLSAPGSSLNEYTAPQFAQKGNSYYNISSDAARPLLGLASDYHLLNATGSLDIPVLSGKYVVLTGDVVKNLGFDRNAVSARVGTDVKDRTLGFMGRVAVGDREIGKRGDWQFFTGYKRVERDAVLDAFTDSDFRLGGTDATGYIIGGSYGIGKNTAASIRFLSADSIDGAPLSVDVLQFDLSARF